MARPLVDAAFFRPDLHAVSDDSRRRQKQREDGRDPEYQVDATLFGGDADPRDADDQQNLHLHKVVKAEFLFQVMAG